MYSQACLPSIGLRPGLAWIIRRCCSKLQSRPTLYLTLSLSLTSIVSIGLKLWGLKTPILLFSFWFKSIGTVRRTRSWLHRRFAGTRSFRKSGRSRRQPTFRKTTKTTSTKKSWAARATFDFFCALKKVFIWRLDTLLLGWLAGYQQSSSYAGAKVRPKTRPMPGQNVTLAHVEDHSVLAANDGNNCNQLWPFAYQSKSLTFCYL